MLPREDREQGCQLGGVVDDRERDGKKRVDCEKVGGLLRYSGSNVTVSRYELGNERI
jgi:hypothetical protein